MALPVCADTVDLVGVSLFSRDRIEFYFVFHRILNPDSQFIRLEKLRSTKCVQTTNHRTLSTISATTGHSNTFSARWILPSVVVIPAAVKITDVRPFPHSD